ncbi:RidA family protein [Castellaniella sp.]|uniref:RidA family protein n=1 Tax=Castellaniella sp. TaxID=1955812 RepID=UPI003A8E967E
MPSLPVSQGHYRIATRLGDLIFTAGMTPRKDGVLIRKGKILNGTPVSDYRACVELAVQNALQAAQSQMTPGERISRVLNTTVYVAAEEGFEGHSKIADLASDHLFARLPEIEPGARTAVGVYTLPGNAPVEIALVVAVQSP